MASLSFCTQRQLVYQKGKFFLFKFRVALTEAPVAANDIKVSQKIYTGPLADIVTK